MKREFGHTLHRTAHSNGHYKCFELVILTNQIYLDICTGIDRDLDTKMVGVFACSARRVVTNAQMGKP